MALYAIGDVQGCYASLQALLGKIRFDPSRDRLWFTGDLVNRGPQSLEVLRFVARLGERAVAVLGNHDLHLLAVAAGAGTLYPQDTLSDILSAPDRAELLAWLSTRPLLHHDPALGCTLVHAGLAPQWDLATAQACAREAEAAIAGSAAGEFFRRMYGDTPDQWNEGLRGWSRLRVIVNALTRLRFCTPEGRMDFQHYGAPGSQPTPLLPWFQVRDRRSRGLRVVFGHWSLLGRWDADGVVCVDTGCLWGRELSALRLDGGKREFLSVACGAQIARADDAKPGWAVQNVGGTPVDPRNER